MAEALAAAGQAKAVFEQARGAVESAVRTERERREAQRAALSAADFARRALTTHERQVAERLAQTSALDEAQRRIEQALAEARGAAEGAEREAAALPVLDALQAELAGLRDGVNRDRAAYAEARARHDGLEREARARAERLLAWIEAQADAGGALPEQVATRALHPERVMEWVDRWGTSARPLLWSHAAYLGFRAELLDGVGQEAQAA